MIGTYVKSDRKAREEIDKIYLNQLPTICAVVAGYYAMLTAMHFIFLPDELVAHVAGSSALASLSALLLGILVKRGQITATRSHVSFLPVALAVGFTVYCHIFLSEDQIQLTNAVLTLFACGLIILSPSIFVLVMTVYVSGFIYGLATLEGPYTIHFAFMLLAATIVSVLGFLLRFRALYRSVRLLSANRAKTKRLATAAKEIKQKMIEAQEANAARDIFLANITHELRTPLTGVMGMLDLVKDSNLKEDQANLIDTASKSASYLLHIVNDLLDFAKLEAGKIELKSETFDPTDITNTATETFRGAAKTKGIDLDFKCTDTSPVMLTGDTPRISQVLLNLINNAVKFTDEGSVHVTFSYDKANSSARWTVTDTGPGIPKEQLARLFERFEQVDSSATRETSGTGLGLAIVDELVTLMNGSVQVESEVGRGSVFMLTLPIPEANSKSGKSAKHEEQREVSGRFGHHRLKALVAEDNEINQMLITRILDKLGISYELVDNGEKVVAKATSESAEFDLIFMDVQMPVMDGVTATKTIKKAGVNTPVIAITANTMEQDIAEYKAAGMQYFVGKPIDIKTFGNVVSEIVEQA